MDRYMGVRLWQYCIVCKYLNNKYIIYMLRQSKYLCIRCSNVVFKNSKAMTMSDGIKSLQINCKLPKDKFANFIDF